MAVIKDNLSKHMVYEDLGRGDGIALWHLDVFGNIDRHVQLTETEIYRLKKLLNKREEG